MKHVGQKAAPYILVALALAAMAWAVSFGTLEPADFTFSNGAAIKTVDPAKATGQPEGRVLNALYEGLYRLLPSDDDPTRLVPAPAAAESHTLSKDGKTYTFKMRAAAKWSDGSPVTAHDFVFSWRRTLHPETASEYAVLLCDYVSGAEKYNSSKVETGDKVEVELNDRTDKLQLFPRGTILAGVLKKVVKPEKPKLPEGESKDAKDKKKKDLAAWRDLWTYVVEVKPTDDQGRVDWNAKGEVRRFCKKPKEGETSEKGVETCLHTLLHFDESVAIDAPDERTLVVRLKNPTPYFLDLVAFYPLYPVNPACVIKHGTPDWTQPKNIVTNGPYNLKFRRIRDRVRMVKSKTYWGAKDVQVETIDALAIKSDITNLNMYLNGQLDWTPNVPSSMIPELRKRDDFNSGPMLTIYMYRLNVNHEALSDARVRRALNMAIDKKTICEKIAKAGQTPARNFVPPIVGYTPSLGGEFNPVEARRLLAEAGFPKGEGFPTLNLLYNTLQNHRDIAQVVASNWKNHLGIDVKLRNLEWAVYLDEVTNRDFEIARGGWIGDYIDPNTFLDMWITDGPNNRTNWSNSHYDKMIISARAEVDPVKRMKIFHEAERILMQEMPVIPIYFQVSKNLVRSYVKNFQHNQQDIHPLHLLRIDPEEKRRVRQAEGFR